MKFIIIRVNLKDGVSITERFVGNNLNLPILKNILIEADNNRIKLTATNLETAINFFVAGKVIEQGKLTVPAGVLLNLISNLTSDRLNLENKSGNKLEIKTDNYEALIQGSPTDEFPIVPKIKNQSEFIEIKAEIIKEALNQTLVAVQFSDLRPELNSILFDFTLDALKLAATDSFRLAEKIINQDQFNTNHKKGFKILIPLKTAQELPRIVKNEDVLKIYHDENQVLFKTEQVELLSRLTEGRFPDYEAIVPKKFNTEIVLNKQELINALKLAGIFGGKNSEVKLKIQENKKIVEITSSDQAIGDNNYILTAKIQGNLKEIIFNWRYLTDALKVINGEDVFLGINKENEPAEIKSPSDSSYFYILKPIVGP